MSELVEPLLTLVEVEAAIEAIPLLLKGDALEPDTLERLRVPLTSLASELTASRDGTPRTATRRGS